MSRKNLPESIYQKVDGKLDVTDLTADLMILADVIGIDKLELLMKEYGGGNFYIPKISSLDKFVQRYLKNNKSKSPKQLASELKVSENFIKKRLR